MINIIHGRKVYNCQWTGEPIFKRFQIPHSGSKSSFSGCYGSVSTATAALADYIKTNEIDKIKADEMFALFEGSIKRIDTGKPKFTIIAAPHYTMLAMFGGSMSLDEFHAKYYHDNQLALYEQVVVSEEDEAEETEPKDASNLPKPWFLTNLSPTTVDDVLVPQAVKVPRCLLSLISFFKNSVDDRECFPNAIVIYLHPRDDNVFAIGSPAYINNVANKRASKLFGNTPVFGPVQIFHKTKLREKGRRKEKAVAAAASSSSEEEDTVTPMDEKAIVDALTSEPPSKKRKRSGSGSGKTKAAAAPAAAPAEAAAAPAEAAGSAVSSK